MNNLPIEIHFPLNDSDILKLLKGIEFNKIQYISPDLKFHIKIYSSDKVKNISYENWKKICALSYSNHTLYDLLREIDNE